MDLGKEENDARRSVYLVTIARVLTTTLETTQGLADVVQMSREQVLEAVRDAVDKPDRVGHGRARSGDGTLVRKMVVYKQEHADGDPHFHVALKVEGSQRFLCWKRTISDSSYKYVRVKIFFRYLFQQTANVHGSAI